MKKTKITHVIVICIFSCSLFFCAQNATSVTVEFNNEKVVDVTENTEVSNIITFVDPVIEAATREILEIPTGDITKEQVLEITKLVIWGKNGKELYGYNAIESLEDLKWFKNLEYLSLQSCNIDNLDGIQNLTSLKALYVSNNQIVNLKPLEDLTNLTHLYCSNNPITDYTPLRKLTNLENLIIDENKNSATNLSFLSEMTQLELFSASECGISDITVLEALTKLDDLDLSYNQISDISALENLENLTYLNLESNHITDLTPIMHLADQLYIPNFYNNPIPEENWYAFFYPIEENHDITIVQGSIHETLPEFTFNIYSYLNPAGNNYPVYEIYALEIMVENKVMQTIPIAELALFSQTNVPESEKNNIFSLEDVNFDGYLDIRLFDTYNAKHINYIYLVWNSEKHQFEDDNWQLSNISSARFDQENKLIYSTQVGGSSRSYLTYQYIGQEIALTAEEEIEFLYLSDEQIKKYLEIANIETDVTEFLIERRTLSERNNDTGEMEVKSDKFQIYAFDDYNYSDDDPKLLIVEVTSELGQIILLDEAN